MKVTLEIYKKVKSGKEPVTLSKRTIQNIKSSDNYSAYRKKYCTRKKDTSIDAVSSSVAILDNQMEYYYLAIKKIHSESFRLLLINILIEIVCFSVLIGMIAW